MCDPVTLTIIGGVSAAGTIAGAGLKAYGQYKTGEAKAAQARSEAMVFGVQADIAKSNAFFLNSEADIVETSTDLAFAKAAQGESRLRKTQDLLEGANRADAANRNLDPTTGSPILIQMRNAMQFQSDIDTMRAQGKMEAADISMRAANLRQQAVGEQGRVFTATISGDSSRLAASNYETAGAINATSEILGGIAKTFNPSSFGTKS
jgi:hypothetical protein